MPRMVDVEGHKRHTKHGVSAVASHRRRENRRAALVGGEENPIILYYPPAELERQARLDSNIASSIYASEEGSSRYIPPEEEGVRAYMEEQRARLRRFQRHGE